MQLVTLLVRLFNQSVDPFGIITYTVANHRAKMLIRKVYVLRMIPVTINDHRMKVYITSSYA